MPDINSTILDFKTAQSDLKLRRKKLLEQFLPFRNSLYKHLQALVNQALEAGLEGLKKCQEEAYSDEVLRATLTLNDFDLVLIATDEAYYADFDDRRLVTRILAYFAGNPDNTPILEVAVSESQGNSYSWLVQWFTQNGPRLLDNGPAPSDDSAASIALTIFAHFCRFDFLWQPKPTLQSMLDRSGSQKSQVFGFVQREGQ